VKTGIRKANTCWWQSSKPLKGRLCFVAVTFEGIKDFQVVGVLQSIIQQ